MKLLITGAGGFIGHNLVEQYRDRHEVCAPGRAELDLLDSEQVAWYLERHGFEAVIHSATDRSTRKLGAGPELLGRNCRMFFNLLRNANRFGKMLFLNSGAVYSRPHAPALVTEEYFDRHIPSDEYGFSKYICARSVPAAGNVYDLRLFGVFGPHEDWEVRFLSNNCCRALWDLPLSLRQNVRFDYLDVEDLGAILEQFLRRDWRHRQYNVCRGESHDLRSLAEMVREASGKQLDILVSRPGWGAEYSGNNGRLMAELPDFRFRPIEDSIRNLYRWHEERKASIDPACLRFDG